MRAIQKARAWSNSVAYQQTAVGARAVFGAPPGGGAFYGNQSYRYQQVTEAYRNWSFIAIRAYMDEVAGGDPPEIGRIVRKDERVDQKMIAKRKAIRSNGGGSDFDHLELRRWEKRKAWGARNWVKKSLAIPEDHEFEAYDHDDPICKPFYNPNGPDVAFDLWAYTVLFHKLCGYVVIWVKRNAYGMPEEMWPIPTQWIQMLVSDGEGAPQGWLVMNPWGRTQLFPFDECIVLQDHSPLSRWEGYAVNIAIAEWLDTYESLVRSRLSQFKNGAVPNVHVALGETYSDPDEAFLARFYAKWFARFQGEDKAGLPIVTGPDIEIKSLGNLPPELFLAGDKDISTNVLAAYKVPKGVVGIEPAADTSAYAPLAQFARYAVNPMLTYYGQVMSEKVIRRTKGYEDGVLHWKTRVPNDPQQINADLSLDAQYGAITPNEIRMLRSRPAYEFGGDDPTLDAKAMVNWGTGQKMDQDQVLDMQIGQQLSGEANAESAENTNGAGATPPLAVQQALGTTSGASGGYLVEDRQTINSMAAQGRRLSKALNGYLPKYQRILNGVH